jgi:dTDP-4-amino-4,6-dideoxygalactose transaminase
MSEVILPLTPAAPPPTPVPLIDLVEQYEAIQHEIRPAVERVFSSQRFVLGEEVTGFEQEMAAYCDARHAIGCASGSDALLLALQALNLGPGDEVITSPYTFFATGSAIERTGARTVYVDIDPATFNLDPEAVAAAITPRTRAVIPVHLFGLCADMEPLWRLSVRHHLALIEDAAQAIGATYRGRQAGVLGTIGCFSFFPTKNLGGAGDGGLMTTDDADLAARLRRLRVHGDVGRYQHVEIGINSRLDAVQAAVLRVKLRHLDAWTQLRRENAARYRELCIDARLTDVLELPGEPAGRGHVYNQFVVRVRDGRRDELLSGLQERGIGCAVYYPQPLHLQPCFASLRYRSGDFPESERASAETIALPIYPELGVERQDRVVRAMAETLGLVGHRKVLPLPQAEPVRRAA